MIISDIMKEFMQTKTYQNLKSAFAGECEAHTKYQYYASQAKKDGYVQIKNIFEETAHNEKEHAKIWFKLLNDGVISDTVTNLVESISVENHEATHMYKKFSEEAYEEGYDDIGKLFAEVAEIEASHCRRYNTLLNNIRKDKVFHKNDKEMWICSNCGHIEIGRDAPEKCPVCQHPRDYFELKAFNYI